MTVEASAIAAPAIPADSTELSLSRRLQGLAMPLGLLLMAVSGWFIHRETPYLPSDDFGYTLGVVGGSLMLALLFYPIRKRVRLLQCLGALKHWFKFHLVAGILGPVLVVYHSAFHVGSFNAAVALASMLLVAASGIVGRFIYRRIHHGLFGSKATLQELTAALDQEIATLQPVLHTIPALAEELTAFRALVSHRPAGALARATHFVSLGFQRVMAEFRVRRAILAFVRTSPEGGRWAPQLERIVDTTGHALRAVQKTAQFATYERLFALWHVVHIPFLCLLVITAIVHVVAVHAY